MDVKRSVNTKIWMDSWFEELKPDEKLIWFYLLTNPNSNMLGIYEISFKRISNDTGIDQNRILTIMKAFESLSKAFYWHGNVFLTNWMRHQSMNPNMLKSAKAIFNDLPNKLIIKLKENGFESFESLSKGLPTLPNRARPEIEIESESEKEIESESEIGKIEKSKNTSRVFLPPNLNELSDYFILKNSNKEEASRMLDYYTSNGWMVGKSKMKNWQAAANNWIRNQDKFQQSNGKSKTSRDKMWAEFING